MRRRSTIPPREAVRRAILATGGTITAAGLVLAGTFGVLAVVTVGQIRQIGAGLALGILLDTFVVRTLLVPSTAVLLGRVNWWPSALWRNQPPRGAVGVEPGRCRIRRPFTSARPSPRWRRAPRTGPPR